MTHTFRRAVNYYRRHGRKRAWQMLLKKVRAAKRARVTAWRYRMVDKLYPGGSQASRQGIHPSIARHEEWLRDSPLDQKSSRAARIFGGANIAIIGDLNLPQCKKYRVVQKVEVLEAMGVSSNFSHFEDVPRCLNILQTATAVIFYRLSADEYFWSYREEADRLGLPIGYDIDDPIFDRSIYGGNKNLEFLTEAERNGLLNGSRGFARAMRLCDFVITSTPGMQTAITQHINNPVYLWRNALDHESLHAAHLAEIQGGNGDKEPFVIGYASGSRAHDADFKVVEKPLASIMERHPHVRLLTIGHVNLPEALSGHSGRISTINFDTYEGYLRHLRSADLNIVPLLSDEFNDCKSAIRYLEASAVGVPTIATEIGDFSNIISPGQNGLLANTPEDWENHMEACITSSSRRRSITKCARDYVTTTQTTQAISAQLQPALVDILMNRSDA